MGHDERVDLTVATAEESIDDFGDDWDFGVV
jgi:hypothetical protein